MRPDAGPTRSELAIARKAREAAGRVDARPLPGTKSRYGRGHSSRTEHALILAVALVAALVACHAVSRPIGPMVSTVVTDL